MLSELISALDDIQNQHDARVLVINGAGPGFCSGADLSRGALPPGLPDYDAGEVLEDYYNPLIEQLFALPLPIVASVHGAVVGAGCAIALAADLLVAARSSYFMQAFVRVGLIPDAGSLWLLPRLVGRARAQAMMMLGERISAETAFEWGLIYKVVADSELESCTGAIAGRLAAGPTRAYELIRRGLRSAAEKTLSQTLALERESQKLAGQTDDFSEGVAAFREKRPAVFRGR
jgi:2-(1,2-epoxy-1,2-dihydrophenyl)acetyl-CoA isomerase